MQRAGHQRPILSRVVSAPPAEITIRILDESELQGEPLPATGSNAKDSLSVAIQRRIEGRLHGRVRNLNVRIQADMVILEGQCATYYTKQLAQHAAMGILEDEQLENAIVVCVDQ